MSCARAWLKLFDPEFLWAIVRDVEVALMALEAFAEPEWLPSGCFVAGAGVRFGIGETFGEEGAVAVEILPLVLKDAESGSETLAGEIGAARAFKDEKAPVADNEFETTAASHGVPTDPVVAFFEMPSAGGPEEDGDG